MFEKINRRDFLKAGLTTGIATVSGVSAGYELKAKTGLPYDLVAIKGGEPEEMFDKGIEAFGGLSKFVKKGQKVVVKPNIGWDVSPERAGNTNPKLVKKDNRTLFQCRSKRCLCI